MSTPDTHGDATSAALPAPIFRAPDPAAAIRRTDTETPQSDWTAMRDRIAEAHRIAPEDRDALLTGADEAMLTAQAERLVDVGFTEPRKIGNYAPKEGDTKNTGRDNREAREYARDLFGTPDYY